MMVAQDRVLKKGNVEVDFAFGSRSSSTKDISMQSLLMSSLSYEINTGRDFSTLSQAITFTRVSILLAHLG